MTTPLAKRLLIIAATLLVFQGGAFSLLLLAKSSEVRPLRADLNDLPYRIGDWEGEDRESDSEITRTVGARQAISRVYRDPSGRQITVHIADWDSLRTPTLPHPPSICYPAGGATVLRQENVAIGDKDPIQAELLVVENKGVESLVLYWYNWEDLVCTTRAQACLARLKMIGSREWPPVVKVMLDIPSLPTEQQARAAVSEFAKEIRQLTKNL